MKLLRMFTAQNAKFSAAHNVANIEKKAKHIQTEGQKKKAKTEKEHKLNVQKHQSKLVSLDPHIKK